MAKRGRPLSVKLSATAIAASLALQFTGNEMTFSANAIDALMRFEDCRAVVYKDSRGLPTAGCGHLVINGEYKIGQQLSEKEIRDLFISDLAPFNRVVNDLTSKAKNGTTQCEHDAMGTFAFNIGTSGFSKSSVLYFHNIGKRDVAAKKFILWNKETINGRKVASKGLTRRRNLEREIYEHCKY